MQQSIDISCPSGPQQLTRRRSGRRPNDGTDSRTDGRTLGSFIDSAAHTMRAVTITGGVYDTGGSSPSCREGPSLQFHVRGEAQKLKKPIAQVGL